VDPTPKDAVSFVLARVSKIAFGEKRGGKPKHVNRKLAVEAALNARRDGSGRRGLERLRAQAYDRFPGGRKPYNYGEHLVETKSYYFAGAGDKKQAESIACIDIDCHAGGTPEGARAFEEYVRGLPGFAGLYGERSTNGRGRHAYLIVEKHGEPAWRVNAALDALQRALGAIRAGGQFDVEGVDVQGRCPVVEADASGRLLVASMGTLAKLPRHFVDDPGALVGTCRLTVGQLLAMDPDPRPPARSGSPRATTVRAREARQGTIPVDADDTGVSTLAKDIIERFPLSRSAHRHEPMRDAALSLLGKGTNPEVAVEALLIWWDHYADFIETPWGMAERKIRQLVRETVKSLQDGRLSYADRTEDEHTALAASITLSPRQQRAITLITENVASRNKHRKKVTDSAAEESAHSKHRKRVTGSGVEDPWVVDVVRFVECLIVLATYKRSLGQGIVFTRKQVRDLARARWPDERFGFEHNQAFEWLKRLFVHRHADGKPAKGVPLLVEEVKGNRDRETGESYASEYMATTLLAQILALGPRPILPMPAAVVPPARGRGRGG
jgi:hypothetical protein